MKPQTKVLQGLAIALLVYLLGMIIFYFRSRGDGQAFMNFFQNDLVQKNLLPVLTAASIPNVALFAWLIQRNKLGVARGILTGLVAMLAVMAYIKFLL